jgi:hypothetical protein
MRTAGLAQTIYRIDRANPRRAPQFDIKVEFPRSRPDQRLINETVTVEGGIFRRVRLAEVSFDREDRQGQVGQSCVKRRVDKPGSF